MQIRKPIAAVAAVLGLTGALALGGAAPAMAQSCTPGNGNSTQNGNACDANVSANLSVATTMTFTLNTTSIAFTGSPGGTSNSPAVTYKILSNDTSGDSVTVEAAAATMTATGDATTIPVADIAVWGPNEQQNGSNNECDTATSLGTPVAACPVALSNTQAATTELATTTDPGTTTYSDYYGFIGPSNELKNTSPGSDIPTGLLPGAYSVGLLYVALAS